MDVRCSVREPLAERCLSATGLMLVPPGYLLTSSLGNALNPLAKAASSLIGSHLRGGALSREFAESLEKRTHLPVKLWDERLTSVEAGRVLRSSGISIQKRAAAVDRLSAVILLQSYLDSL